MIQVRLLGQFDVRRDGTLVAIPSRAAQSLLAYLLLTAGARHRREKLAGLLWPEATEENARRNLRHELWRLRQAIETNPRREGAITYLVADEISIGFNPEAEYWLDVFVLQKPVAQPTSADQLIEWLSLYRGELLPGFYDEWVVLERERVRAVLEQQMARLIDLLIQEKRWPDVLDWGEHWIAWGQTPEPAYRALMLAHSASGNRSQVAAVYERAVQSMRNELGVEPSEQTRALFERLSKIGNIPEVAQTRSAGPPSLQTAIDPEKSDVPIAAPASTLPSRSRNLPLPLTSFIGREHEIKYATSLLASTRLLSLIGTGGVGKTRLAIRLATDLASQYQAGAVWVELAALADPDFVPQAVAKAMALRETENVPLIETLADALCSKQVLLVLDNCEHLVTATARLAEYLLRTCASLKILTTSRESLGIPGETIWTVPSLSLPQPEQAARPATLDAYESIRLFVERARDAYPDFALDDQNAPLIVQICRRLDGMPLAIELAAARCKMLAIQQIAARLDDRFQLLTQTRRTALAHQQTLRATMDWSHDLLSDEERTLFRRLSIFAGGWTLEAAESVCAGDGLERGQVLQTLSRLIDKSLAVVQEQGDTARYRLLETIREYAREKLLEAGEADWVGDRHLDYFLQLAQESEPRLFGESPLFDRLDAEMDNLATAIEWSIRERKGEELEQAARTQAGLRLAGALTWFFHGRYRQAAAELLKEILASEGARPRTAARAKALNAAGFLQFSWGYSDQSCQLLEEALSIGRELRDKLDTAWALVFLGWGADSVGDYQATQTYLEQALTISNELGDGGKSIRGVALAFLGDVPLTRGDVGHAQQLYDEGVVILKELQDKNYVSYPLRRLGYIALRRGDYSRAIGLFRSSLTLNLQVGDQTSLIACLAGFAACYTAQRNNSRAVQLYGAVNARLAALKLRLLSYDRIDHDEYLEQVRAQMDPVAFQAAWSAGEGMSLDEAVAFASGPSVQLEMLDR